MNNDQLIEKAEAKAKELYPLEAVSIKDPSGRIRTIEQQEAFVACAKWMAGEGAALQLVRDSVQKPDCEAPQAPSGPTRTGRIHYGGYRQHTVHYVIPDDDPKYLLKVSEVSRKIAADRMAESQRQQIVAGYEGPFGLPHHCFTHGQTVSFTVDEAGEAVILFDQTEKAQ